MSAYDLARPELRDLVPYKAKQVADDYTRLNANEAPLAPYATDAANSTNRYPELRPRSLQLALARLFAVDAASLCPLRGSSEAIDLLIRTFCRAYRDNIVVLPPTFEMYAVYAQMQAAEVRCAPLQIGDTFSVDWQALDAQCDDHTRIVFLCSPNNPTGHLIPREEILAFAERRAGKSIVVVDEAYVEFSGQESLASEINRFDNLAVLRTLSKAYALAGARCGVLIGCSEIVNLVAALMSPYALSTPVTGLILDALQSENLAASEQQISVIVAERDRLQQLLQGSPAIEKVWPSAANFLLVRLNQPATVRAALAERHILIREFKAQECLRHCARITVGTAAETDRLMQALSVAGESIQ